MGNTRAVTRRDAQDNITHRTCHSCGQEKLWNLKNFAPDLCTIEGLDRRCRDCRVLDRLLHKLYGTSNRHKLEMRGVNWRQHAK